jgi:hypothetical protein
MQKKISLRKIALKYSPRTAVTLVNPRIVKRACQALSAWYYVTFIMMMVIIL